jgi:hypothetical protein
MDASLENFYFYFIFFYVSNFSPQGISEDCLYLNIYAPANATAGSLPVMFFIHGGRFDSDNHLFVITSSAASVVAK